MTYTLVLVVGLANIALVLILGSLVRWLVRQQAKERERLLDQLFHAVRNPWRPAPAMEIPDALPDEPDYIFSPEGEPDS